MVPLGTMVSRSIVLSVKKKTSSYKASVQKPKALPKRAAAALKDGRTNSVLFKRPSCVTRSSSASSEWHEFTPKTINDKYCLARTWDDGHGGQCTRRALNNVATQLCAPHKFESELPLGLPHGLVTGAIPARKLEEFKSVRAFREAARQAVSHGQSHSSDAAGDQEVSVLADDGDAVPANVPHRNGDVQSRSVQCWHRKKILPRRKRGTYMKGDTTFSKELFEQLALQASNDAPDYLCQQNGYPTPLLGSLRCNLFGFERDLDGIRPNTLCIYEWQFSHERIEGVETTYRVKHKCRNLCYTRMSSPRPPWQVRTAACVVSPSFNTLSM